MGECLSSTGGGGRAGSVGGGGLVFETDVDRGGRGLLGAAGAYVIMLG